MSSKNLLIIGLLGFGAAAYLYSQNKKDATADKRTALINTASDPAEKATITPIFNKMTDDEINICYDVVITKIYGQNIPVNVKNQMKIISEKYNIFT
jgi:hypothetical protein